MNEKESKRIIDKSMDWISVPYYARRLGCAEGYLEAIEKAQKLVEALKRSNARLRTFKSDESDIINLNKKALAQWEKEK